VNVPRVSLHTKNTNNVKSEVRFKQLIRGAFTIDSSTPTLKIHLNEHPIPSQVLIVLGSLKIKVIFCLSMEFYSFNNFYKNAPNFSFCKIFTSVRTPSLLNLVPIELVVLEICAVLYNFLFVVTSGKVHRFECFFVQNICFRVVSRVILHTDTTKNNFVHQWSAPEISPRTSSVGNI
jgi:hypothetical protein